ncbi:bifunctional 3,4-dihydroxy-2-butanone 4-phosphate synthase/GTP cyclohydrolase II protein [Candidatus Nanopelagicaceae bacterium]
MSNLQTALDTYKNGDLIIVTDDADRENEGDLMLRADLATPEKIAFMVRYTTGILCVAMTQDRARQLRLPLMVEENQDSKKTAFTVSVDYKVGITTGVSATERANTVRALADNSAVHSDFIRPGHVFPLIADNGGLQARGGHTEAGVALSYLVGAQPLCLLSEIVNDDGSMARGASLDAFATQHSIPMISVQELKGVAPVLPSVAATFEFAWAELPLRTGIWKIATFPGLRQREHAVIAFGSADTTPMIRIHSECFTGDVVHSQRCDCGEQLEQSITAIQNHGFGYIVYLRDHEGRGIGLTEKIKAYQLQDKGMDTIDANLHLGHEIDARDWSDAISIIKALDVTNCQLLTNNPNKVAALKTAGVAVIQTPLVIASNKFNEKYLATKEEKLGHTRGGK